ncbi:MAG: adenosylcobinamide amidohydrolase [Deltaproteobacteria bacterium]|jgi:adenosylcobinamide amidohydrolase/ABC-type Fe3+-hydroxamate transport system substrate-binding protein|nr:adenosylcobinamide amidohydrolase [Deltaproteobacteria bacterium]
MSSSAVHHGFQNLPRAAAAGGRANAAAAGRTNAAYGGKSDTSPGGKKKLAWSAKAWRAKATAAAAAFALALAALTGAAGATDYVDDEGTALRFSGSPKRTVSLAPGATEILCSIGAGDSIAAVTLEDNYFECIASKPRVGPAKSPDYARVLSFRPDLVIVPPAEAARAKESLSGSGAKVLVYGGPSDLEGADRTILALGDLFGKKAQARAAAAESQGYLDMLARKTGIFTAAFRKRVMRLRALDGGVGTGGPGTLDWALIEAAGGIPWQGGEPGGISPVSGKDFAAFDPQYVYACEEDRTAAEAIRKKSPFRGAAAFRNGGTVHYFPCALTDRLSAHAGYFAAWLSGDIYSNEYGDPANLVFPQEIIGEKPLTIKGIPYVKGAKIVEYRMFDFIHRTLLVEFASPQTVVTTGEGAVHDVNVIGNSYSPPMVWNINHKGGWAWAEGEIYKVLGLDRERTSLIFTGADMRNLAVKSASYKDLTVTALVTAGAESNALRTSRDPGAFYEPGTINIIILSNRKLSPNGATAAIIVATEAKTAALWDMDIRSSESPLPNPATGTGTDDVLVAAAGTGKPINYTGGHGKVGELIARVVYDGVTEALRKQNGKAPRRSVWERLAERDVDLANLGPAFSGQGPYPALAEDIRTLMLDPAAKSLLEAAFSLSDAQVMGHLEDHKLFDAMALQAATSVAGKPVTSIRSLVTDKSIPPVLKTALDALATGILVKKGL